VYSSVTESPVAIVIRIQKCHTESLLHREGHRRRVRYLIARVDTPISHRIPLWTTGCTGHPKGEQTRTTQTPPPTGSSLAVDSFLGVAGVVGLLGAAGSTSRSLSGGFGGYDAPETQPMVTTRGGSTRTSRRNDRAPGTSTDRRRGGPVRPRSRCGRRVGPRSGVHRPIGARSGDRRHHETDGPPVIGYSWASNVDWGPAKTADANVAPLSLTGCRRGRLTTGDQSTCSHSLGARVTGRRSASSLTVSGQTSSPRCRCSAARFRTTASRPDGRYGPAIAAVDAPRV